MDTKGTGIAKGGGGFKVKVLVAQPCPTLCDPRDCSPPGSSVHGTGKNTGVGCHTLLQGTFPTQGLNPGLLHYRRILYHLSHWGNWWSVEERWISRALRIFRTMKNTIYDIIMMKTCHYTFVQTHRMYNIKSEPLSKLWTLDDYNVTVGLSLVKSGPFW